MTETNDRIEITRMFDAPREMVWKAWTDPEMIKKWWGPKNFIAPEIKTDFRVGGKYLFCMRGAVTPDAEPVDLWSTGVYKEIVPMERLVVTDSFSDKEGNIVAPSKFGMSEDFPENMDITILFEEQEGKTKLTIQYAKPESQAAFEALLKSGMKDGWNESLDKLADSLKS